MDGSASRRTARGSSVTPGAQDVDVGGRETHNVKGAEAHRPAKAAKPKKASRARKAPDKRLSHVI